MAYLEFRMVMFGVIFMFILNTLLVLFVSPDQIQDFNQDSVIEDITDELGAVSGFITSALLNIGIAMFGLFGIDFIAYVSVLPLWVLSALTLYNIIIVFALIFYLVDRIWVG